MAAEHDQKKVVHAHMFPLVWTIIFPDRWYASFQRLFSKYPSSASFEGADIAFTDERQSVFSTSNYIKYTISSARILSIPGLPFSLSYTNKLHIHKSTNPSLLTHTPNKSPSSLHFLNQELVDLASNSTRLHCVSAEPIKTSLMPSKSTVC